MHTTTRNAYRLIQSREPFTTGGALAGTDRPERPLYLPWQGRLPNEWAATLNRLAHERGGITYIVASYGTPIGIAFADGSTVIPDVKYSVTTSRHQSQVRTAWLGAETSLDETSSASRQHKIDTGSYLLLSERLAESEEDGEALTESQRLDKISEVVDAVDRIATLRTPVARFRGASDDLLTRLAADLPELLAIMRHANHGTRDRAECARCAEEG